MGWFFHHHGSPQAAKQRTRGMTRVAKIHRGLLRIISRSITLLLRANIPVTFLGNPVFLLTVRGRKTGQPRSFPVDLYEHNGRRFLVASHGEGDWVRNLRASGVGLLRRGSHNEELTAVALTPAVAGPILKEVLSARLASPNGFVLRQSLGLTPEASADDFISAAQRCPVFELHTSQAPFSSE